MANGKTTTTRVVTTTRGGRQAATSSAGIAPPKGPSKDAPARRRRRGSPPQPFGGQTVTTGRPQVTTRAGRTTIAHRECIATVTPANAAFAVLSNVPINPGLIHSFPWLQGIATAYERYRFMSLQYEYVPQCSVMTDGAVAMCVDYDASDAPPANMQDLLMAEGAVSASLHQPCKLVVPQARLHNFAGEHFVRAAGLSHNSDIKTYDVGNFFLAQEGSSRNATCGRLFVTYKVEFWSPQRITVEDRMRSRSGSFVSGSGRTALHPFGNSAAREVGGINLTYTPVSGAFTIPEAGRYQVEVDGHGETLTSWLVDVVGGAAATITNYANGAGDTTSGNFIIETAVPFATMVFTLLGAARLDDAHLRIAPAPL